MTWVHPEWLWGLAAISALFLLGAFLLRRRERRLASLLDPAAADRLAPRRAPGRARLRLALTLAAAACIVAALARPQWGFRWEEVRRRGLNIMIVLDTSNSMRAGDLKPNRLQRARWGVRDLVRKLKGDRVGLVAFAGSSFLQCPLTSDYPAFLMTLDDVYPGLIPRGGTAIEQALRAALEQTKTTGEADSVIVLITDGEDHEGNPMSLVEEFRRRDIRLYAVGVGTPEGELVPAAGNDASSFLKNRDGNVVKSRLNETLLQQLALATGGAYIRATPQAFGLEQVYDEGIDRLRRDEQDSRRARVGEERLSWFLGAALFLLACEAVFDERRRLRPAEEAA